MMKRSLRKYLYISYLVAQFSLCGTSYPQVDQLPEISRWYNSYDCAISLRFDDNLDSHVEYVIPLLNEYDFKATFMINPGRNYDEHKDFWEIQLPQMGHKLGNHTWHHEGAKNPEEAEFEIGEVSKLIWQLYPNESKLNVFASGGGEEWGGEPWEKALPVYKEIVKEYYLIDLYDGNHPNIDLNSDYSMKEIKSIINETISKRKYQAFSFHKIGSKSLVDYARKIITGYNYTFEEEQLLEMIKYLNSKRENIWIAPIIQILKYETEFENSTLELVKRNTDKIVMRLKIETDPSLYDQELTLILPTLDNLSPVKILQDDFEGIIFQLSDKEFISNIKPIESSIVIYYK
jgi:hypothetical protein